jgi:hypothetical protein
VRVEVALGDARVAACRVSAALARARSESTSADRATTDARSRVVGCVNIPGTRPRARERVRGASTLSWFFQLAKWSSLVESRELETAFV